MKKTKDKRSVAEIVADLRRRSGFEYPTIHKGHQRKPSLYWYCRTEKGWRYLRAASKDDPITQQYPGGRWFIRQRDSNGTQAYVPVEGDATAALGDAKKRAQAHDYKVPYLKKHHGLREAAAALYAYYRDNNQDESAKKSKDTLKAFQQACPDLRTVKGITQQHVLRFHKWLKTERGNSERTINNHHKRLVVFIKFCNLDWTKIVPKKITPQYNKDTQPTIYTQNEIDRLLSESDEHMQLAIELGRQLGLREQEMMYATFDNIDGKVYWVREKPSLGFTIKNRKTRSIPMSGKLRDTLMESKNRRPRQLILGRGKGYANVDLELLAKLKRVARRAEVGEFEAGDHEKDSATLHKFRRTALTAWLRSGLDVKTVQRFAGHASLESTLRYLRALDAETLTDHMSELYK